MVMDSIASILGEILNFIAPISPYVGQIIKFVIPIYIAIGEVFYYYGELLLSLLPTSTNIVSYILCGIFIVLGLLGGFLGKSKKEKKEIANKTYTPPASTYAKDKNTYDY